MKLPNCNTLARRAARGFTLIELMIVISVVAILTTIAVTSYRAYVLRATRTEARMALLSIQVAQEKFFLQNNQYAQNLATALAAPPAGLGVALAAGGVTNGGHYTISFTAATANTYTVQAVATGTQTSDKAACLTYTINDQGVRTPADSSGCWR
ncbi:MAG TPA: type IV pilin protein [Steroidobacteraceae bacterium]|nr:type IV pilin protein [Steroidobacteraceae bacterium]